MALEPGRGRTAVPVRPALIGAVAGVAGVVAALTFGASLGHLVDTPASYGFNWQLSPDLFEDEPERLAERSEVEDLGLLHFRQTTIEGEDLDGQAVLPLKGNPSLTVLDGRMPTTPGEVALGPKTMDGLGAGIGDRLDALGADEETLEVEVVGEVLFPTVDDNPFNEGVAVHPDLAVDVARVGGLRAGDRDVPARDRPGSGGGDRRGGGSGVRHRVRLPVPATRRGQPGPGAPDAAGVGRLPRGRWRWPRWHTRWSLRCGAGGETSGSCARWGSGRVRSRVAVVGAGGDARGGGPGGRVAPRARHRPDRHGRVVASGLGVGTSPRAPDSSRSLPWCPSPWSAAALVGLLAGPVRRRASARRRRWPPSSGVSPPFTSDDRPRDASRSRTISRICLTALVDRLADRRRRVVGAAEHRQRHPPDVLEEARPHARGRRTRGVASRSSRSSGDTTTVPG